MASTIHPRTREALHDAIRNVYQHADLGLPRPGENGNRRSLALGVTSAKRQEGKTTVAIGLAGALAEDTGHQVTLVDSDVHTHSIEQEFGLFGIEGLTDVLDGESSLQAVRHPVPASSLSVVTAGTRLGQAERSLRTEHALTLIENMREANTHVVFDLPATLPNATAPVLARLLDGVIVVVRCGSTSRQELDATLEKLSGANILGVVLNRWESTIPSWLERLLALRN